MGPAVGEVIVMVTPVSVSVQCVREVIVMVTPVSVSVQCNRL